VSPARSAVHWNVLVADGAAIVDAGDVSPVPAGRNVSGFEIRVGHGTRDFLGPGTVAELFVLHKTFLSSN